jgi:hypothetical protein
MGSGVKLGESAGAVGKIAPLAAPLSACFCLSRFDARRDPLWQVTLALRMGAEGTLMTLGPLLLLTGFGCGLANQSELLRGRPGSLSAWPTSVHHPLDGSVAD